MIHGVFNINIIEDAAYWRDTNMVDMRVKSEIIVKYASSIYIIYYIFITLLSSIICIFFSFNCSHLFWGTSQKVSTPNGNVTSDICHKIHLWT